MSHNYTTQVVADTIGSRNAVQAAYGERLRLPTDETMENKYV